MTLPEFTLSTWYSSEIKEFLENLCDGANFGNTYITFIAYDHDTRYFVSNNSLHEKNLVNNETFKKLINNYIYNHSYLEFEL